MVKKSKDEPSVEEIFLKYGERPPKKWNVRQIPKYMPRADCFKFVPDLKNHQKGKCSALNRLYCKYEKCSFYKPLRKETKWKEPN